MDPEENEGKGNPLRANLKWIIIAAAVIIGLIVFSTVRGREPSEASPGDTTLDSLNATVSVYGTRLATVEGTAALHTEDIADLRSDVDSLTSPTDWSSEINSLKNRLNAEEAKSSSQATTIADLQDEIAAFNTSAWAANCTALWDMIGDLQNEVNEIDAVDWSGNITLLNDRMYDLEDSVSSMSSILRYAMVSDLGADYLIAEVFGAGNYPVVLTLYGNALEADDVKVYPPIPGHEITACSIGATYLSSSNATLTVVVEPDSAWLDEDAIMLQILEGDIDYATAIVAEKR